MYSFPIIETSGDKFPTVGPSEDQETSLQNPTNCETQIFEFHGKRIAGFKMVDRQMVCLPQIYELFLKQHVGGLHTVYTKLKRLNIHPAICNVDQVRTLRSLGAIQPGVNRCKLINREDFDKLYKDCTESSSRPGRPPKRSLLVGNPSSLSTRNSQAESSGLQNSSFDSYMNDRNLFPHLLPLNAQQIFVQHLMATAAVLAKQQEDKSTTVKRTRLEEITKDTEKQGDTYTKSEWNQEKTDKQTPSPKNSESSNENSSAPSLPSNSNSSESDNFFDREKSSSLMNNSDRGSSSGSSSENSTRNFEMQNMFTIFTTTVDEMEKRFKEHYDKLSAMATKMQKLEEQLLRNLAVHRERSQHYYRRYISVKYQVANLKGKRFQQENH
ncbi:hypothetical protein FO519_005455 [Halicephalobus sp. NKZ332]|nr:hypothetical protein FO519_005455 [Halicephalobus sp. NKZ332]